MTTHLIERSIKTYIVWYQHRGGDTPVPVDISFGIAGNISLGLQSLLFVEARLRAPRRDRLNPDQLRDALSNDLALFWRSAADKTVQYACAWIHPDEPRPRLFRALAAPGHHGSLDEVAAAGDVLLTVVGDDADVAEREVRAEATAALYAIPDLSPHGAHFASSVRVLRRWMRDENRAGVGGTMQAILTAGTPQRADHFSVLTNERYSFRGVNLDALLEPGAIGEGKATFELDQALYDPDVPWDQVVAPT